MGDGELGADGPHPVGGAACGGELVWMLFSGPVVEPVVEDPPSAEVGEHPAFTGSGDVPTGDHLCDDTVGDRDQGCKLL